MSHFPGPHSRWIFFHPIFFFETRREIHHGDAVSTMMQLLPSLHHLYDHNYVIRLLVIVIVVWPCLCSCGCSAASVTGLQSSSSTTRRTRHHSHNQFVLHNKRRRIRHRTNAASLLSSLSSHVSANNIMSSHSSQLSLDQSTLGSSSSSSSYRGRTKRHNKNSIISHQVLQAVQAKFQTWKEKQGRIFSFVEQMIPPQVWSVCAGAASFGITLAFSTTAQQRIFGISTGTTPPIPTLVGVASVCAASTVAHQVALATHAYVTTGTWPRNFSLWPRRNGSAYFGYHEKVLDIKICQIPMHAIRVWTMGLLCFKLCGGRFWAVAPSSVTHLGSYARASLPATERYATAAQRLQIERLGKLWGCHTCGSHRWTLLPRIGTPNVQFVGDHMPPKSVAEQLNKSLLFRLLRRKVRYRFYPQCIRCSNQQGSLLSQATAALQSRRGHEAARRLAAVGGGRRASYNHGWQPRLSHALTGAAIAAIATLNVHPADLMDENRWRYAAWQEDLLKMLRQGEPEEQEHLRGGATCDDEKR